MCTIRPTPARRASATTCATPATFTSAKRCLRSVGTATVWITASTPSNAPRSDSGLRTSARRTSTFVPPPGSSFSAPGRSLISARTSCPPSSSRAIACRPTNPFAPVTATRIGSPPLVLRGRSSSTLPARVNTSARGQNREHQCPANRVYETEELRLLEPVDEEGVQAQERREEAKPAEEQQVGPVHPALGGLATDPAPIGDERDEDQDHDEAVVRRNGMHGLGLAERRRIRVANAPGKSRTCDRVMLAVDHIADAPDRLAERDADHRDVEHEADRKAQPAGGEVAGDRRADGRAGGADPAVPEREDIDGM